MISYIPKRKRRAFIRKRLENNPMFLFKPNDNQMLFVNTGSHKPKEPKIRLKEKDGYVIPEDKIKRIMKYIDDSYMERPTWGEAPSLYKYLKGVLYSDK